MAFLRGECGIFLKAADHTKGKQNTFEGTIHESCVAEL